jgi:hypothetical protein
MGGSGKWVKSLIGLKKPEKEDGKVRGIMGVLGLLLGGGKCDFYQPSFLGVCPFPG